jgi:signal transduction histidine kinase
MSFAKHIALKNRLLQILVGMLIGIVIIHPLTLVINEFFDWRNGHWHFFWFEIPLALKSSFSISHLPQALVYGVLTSAVLLLWSSTVTAYRRIASQSQRFALIGRQARIIVHDFKNPLFGIQAFTSLLKETITGSDQIEYCDRIQISAEQISDLLNEIQALTLTDVQVALNKQPVFFDEFLKDTVKKIVLHAHLEIEENVHTKVLIDQVFFSRAILNLLKNADEALMNRDDGEIRVSLKPSGKKILIEIADNGSGIPQNIRKDLFRFGVTYGKTHGTGLGLFITKQIVESHGGTISYRTSSEGGSVFQLTLPRE